MQCQPCDRAVHSSRINVEVAQSPASCSPMVLLPEPAGPSMAMHRGSRMNPPLVDEKYSYRYLTTTDFRVSRIRFGSVPVPQKRECSVSCWRIVSSSAVVRLRHWPEGSLLSVNGPIPIRSSCITG